MVRTLALATALVAGLGFTVAANAGDAKLVDCLNMAKQVTTALEAAQPGATTDQARDMARNARTYCSSSRYDNGVALYSKALTALGKN